MALCIAYLNILINLAVSLKKLFTSLEQQIGPHRKIILYISIFFGNKLLVNIICKNLSRLDSYIQVQYKNKAIAMFWYDKKGSYNLLFLLSMRCYDFSCVTKFNCHSKINEKFYTYIKYIYIICFVYYLLFELL